MVLFAVSAIAAIAGGLAALPALDWDAIMRPIIVPYHFNSWASQMLNNSAEMVVICNAIGHIRMNGDRTGDPLTPFEMLSLDPTKRPWNPVRNSAGPAGEWYEEANRAAIESYDRSVAQLQKMPLARSILGEFQNYRNAIVASGRLVQDPTARTIYLNGIGAQIIKLQRKLQKKKLDEPCLWPLAHNLMVDQCAALWVTTGFETLVKKVNVTSECESSWFSWIGV